MKTSIIVSLAMIGALIPGLAEAATASGTGNASAKVVSPVSVTEGQSLNFGTMTNEYGTVNVSPSGIRSSSEDNLVNDGNYPSAGMFTISGPANQQISIQMPASGVTISNGYDFMSVSLNSDTSGAAMIDSSGTLVIRIGGETNPGGHSSGDYSGSYTINVNY